MQIMQKGVGWRTWRQILNKSHLFNFLKYSQILLWNINNLNSAKKSKKHFLKQKIPKYHFTTEIAQVRPIFGYKFNFRVNVWEQNTEI